MREEYMRHALELAGQAASIGEVPVGCVIVKDGDVIGTGYNRRETARHALAHAELIAIDRACRALNGWRLESCDVYVTLEPCPMCAGALILARVENVFFGAWDKKFGALGSVVNLFELSFNHKPSYTGGILQQQSSDMLKEFFAKLRAN